MCRLQVIHDNGVSRTVSRRLEGLAYGVGILATGMDRICADVPMLTRLKDNKNFFVLARSQKTLLPHCLTATLSDCHCHCLLTATV